MTNKYKSITEGQEETWYPIKCGKCGFKDATTDKSTWTCPECEISVKKILVAGMSGVAVIKKLEADQMKVSHQAINEAKAIQHTAEKQVQTDQFLKDFHNVLGTKPAEPAVVKSEFKVGGLACKIVSTKKD